MDYSELTEYSGTNKSCSYCEREFTEGEVIMVDPEKGHTFCYGNCMTAFVFVAGEALIGVARRFGGSPVLPPVNPVPNYDPDQTSIPINYEKKRHFDKLRRLLNF